jgi:branched-chain amino acid transport system permease protein
MTSRLRPAVFSAMLVWVIAFPIFGLKLGTVDIRLEVEGTGSLVLMVISVCSLLLFLRELFAAHLDVLWRSARQRAGDRGDTARFAVSARSQRWALLALALVAVIWPFFGTRGAVDLAILVLIYVLLGIGLNIVVGLAGLLDLGYVGFYAVGAYTYALLAQYAGLGFWTALPLAGAMAALFGFLLGFPVLRLRGDYLAIVTLGFGEIIRLLLRNLTDVTGGPNGINGIAAPGLFGLSFDRRVPEGMTSFHTFFGLPYRGVDKVIFLYLIALSLSILALFVINRLRRMPLGRAWEALREDETACRALGLNPTTIKLSAFTFGAAFAGFAGCFFAAKQGSITPGSFGFLESAIILAIVVLGGMGSQLGVILAAIVLTLLPELMRELNDYRMLMFGAVMVLMMLWRPQGLMPVTRPHLKLPDASTS